MKCCSRYPKTSENRDIISCVSARQTIEFRHERPTSQRCLPYPDFRAFAQIASSVSFPTNERAVLPSFGGKPLAKRLLPCERKSRDACVCSFLLNDFIQKKLLVVCTPDLLRPKKFVAYTCHSRHLADRTFRFALDLHFESL